MTAVSVAVDQPTIDIKASVFEFDVSTRLVVASGSVVVTQGPMRITSRRAMFDQDKRRIQMMDKVVVNRGDLQLTCQTLLAYGLSQHIEANGGITFRYQDIRGQADNARYRVMDDVLELMGSPIAKQGQNSVSGDYVRVDMKRGKIRTEGRANVSLDPGAWRY